MKKNFFTYPGRLLGRCMTLMASVAFSVISADGFAAPAVSSDEGRLAGKVALVTGAGSGIGERTASLFAREGATVIVVDIAGQSARKTADAINRERGRAQAITADVTKEADVSAMIDTTVKTYGRLDILVNNAGVFDMLIPAGEVSDNIWNRVIATNLTAPLRTIRKAIPVFEKQKGGVIVNIASIAG